MESFPARRNRLEVAGIMAPVHRWSRHSPMTWPGQSPLVETWVHTNGHGPVAHEVAVRVGKPLDVMRFRCFCREQVEADVAYLRDVAQRLYADPSRLCPVARCPCCDAATELARPFVTMYGAAYVRCGACGHVFVGRQPAREDLEQFFAGSEEVASVYTDEASLELRLRQVIVPKIDWMLDVYRRHFDRAPTSVLDVGAGAGHFVAGCQRAGLKASGLEMNASAVRFARERLGVCLRQGNFLAATPAEEAHDVVTLWGVLEYVPEPLTFLHAARRWLTSTSGLLVVEVPRADCFSTFVQAEWTDTPVRHAVPSSHMNLFSDASLATLLVRAGLRPVAAWYFGMDAYEMLVQQALASGEPALVERLAGAIPGLQSALDAGRLCDDVLLAAVPATAPEQS